MANFPSIQPTAASAGGRASYRVLRAPFGDGYTQRTADGINAVDREWTGTWTLLNSSDFQTIISFLDARGGWDAFTFTVPGEPSARKWTCKEYSWKQAEGSVALYEISATFVQVHDL